MSSYQIGNYTVLLSEQDVDRVAEHTWSVHVKHGVTYAVTHIRTEGTRKHVRMHRFILQAAPGTIVDHINHNGLDNRRENLRIVDVVTSNRHRRKVGKATSDYKGVQWWPATKKWKALIRINGVQTYITTLADERKAAQAYDLFAVRFWEKGQYVLNFPELEARYMTATQGNPTVKELQKVARKGGY